MDWNEAIENDRRMLKRIVALLYAFAGLAESLCDRPQPIRGVVFWILRYAEIIARDFVMDTALDQGAPVALDLSIIPALHAGESPSDAMRLSESFQELAVLLDWLADSTPGCRRVSLIKLCLTLAACAANAHPPAGTRVGPRQFCLAHPQFVIGRCDSS